MYIALYHWSCIQLDKTRSGYNKRADYILLYTVAHTTTMCFIFLFVCSSSSPSLVRSSMFLSLSLSTPVHSSYLLSRHVHLSPFVCLPLSIHPCPFILPPLSTRTSIPFCLSPSLYPLLSIHPALSLNMYIYPILSVSLSLSTPVLSQHVHLLSSICLPLSLSAPASYLEIGH